MRRKASRWISICLVCALGLSLFSFPALAAPESGTDGDEDLTILSDLEDTSDPVEDLAGDGTGEETPVVSEPPAPETEPDADAGAEPEPEEEPDAGPDTVIISEELGGASGEAMLAPTGATVTVSYYDSDKKTLIASETVAEGGKPAAVPTANADGTAVSAWVDADGALAVPADTAVTGNVSYYAWYRPRMNASETNHTKYISGTGNANFSPSASLTRAQAAIILYRLLGSTELGPYNCEFTDVRTSDSYYTEVTTLASYGIINGYGDQTFWPGYSVTRAEFVTMLVRLMALSGGGSASFTDTSGHWAKANIATAASLGWINGYTDKTFRPDNSITRAEAVVVVNRVLGRSTGEDTADTDTIDGGSVLHFLDVPLTSGTSWYYYAVMEAANSHTCSASDGKETWTSYTKESSGLSKGIHQSGSVFCYVDGNGQPVKLTAGINKIDGKYLYAAAAGYTASVDFSSKTGYAVTAAGSAALKTGPQRIGSYYFCWDGSKNEPKYMSAGLNTLSGAGYWADAAGYQIRSTMKRGVVSLGGKNYLASNAYSLVTTGLAHNGATTTLSSVDLRGKTYEFDYNMYYIQSDYSLATDSWQGYLYFGKDCKYTSSDSTLDGYVWNVVKSFINSTTLTQEQKLLKAYYYIRGGEGSHYGGSYGTSPFSYRASGQLFYSGRYNRQSHFSSFIGCAKQFYSLGYGRCYEWASGYHYVARRLGFQCYLVVGWLWQGMNIHCWNMIYWSGVWHISDVEIEWGHLSGYYSGGKCYRNLFDQALDSEWVTSYKSAAHGSILYTFPS